MYPRPQTNEDSSRSKYGKAKQSSVIMLFVVGRPHEQSHCELRVY